MSLPKNRSANRMKRKEGRATDHQPLLRLVQEEKEVRSNRVIAPIVLKPKTQAQADYDQQIASKLITFGIGPAGTGKTWWAAMRAAEMLKAGEIEKIVITRPAVEAGEEMGFLPGELEEKYEPYFRPVRDALLEGLGSGFLEYALKAGKVEARPLAYLRGATLKNCWLIADEMQNATVSQMRLLLTRFGENAKFIINGDEAQCDLPDRAKSGLMDAVRRLSTNSRVGVTTFGIEDVVRHGIVQEIIEAYSR